MPTSHAFRISRDREIYEPEKLQCVLQEPLLCHIMMYPYSANNLSMAVFCVENPFANVLEEYTASFFRAEIPTFCN
jgi:hypothetical protein